MEKITAIYKCPFCKEKLELELTKNGQLLLQAPSKEEGEF